MKLWLVLAFALVFFSGCNSRTQKARLQNMNAKQSLLIKQQKAQIVALQEKLAKQKMRKSRQVRGNTIPTAPKRHIKLKKVEDNNYSSGYMYPSAKKKKKTTQKVTPASVTKKQRNTSSTSMGKAECIAMIGQTKFDKYTQMFGSEAASIKRCNMLKAMR